MHVYLLFFTAPPPCRSHVCHWDHGVGSAAAVEAGPRVVRSGSEAQARAPSRGHKGAHGRLRWRKRGDCGRVARVQHR